MVAEASPHFGMITVSLFHANSITVSSHCFLVTFYLKLWFTKNEDKSPIWSLLELKLSLI